MQATVKLFVCIQKFNFLQQIQLNQFLQYEFIIFGAFLYDHFQKKW